MKNKKHLIVYSFQSLEDPLMKGLMLNYLISLSAGGKYIFHLITHEQTGFALNETDQKNKKTELLNKSIYWYPIQYHSGRFLILKKAFDFLRSFLICLRIKLKFKTKVIIGFLPIAAGYSSIIAPVLRMKLITYCFEPHSEYMADFGIWSKKSLKYILLKKYEKEQVEVSSVMIVPTHYTEKYVSSINPYSKKYVFPISIDTDKNIFNPEFRNRFRMENNLRDKKVILYLGKFGGIYYEIHTFLNFLIQFNANTDFHAMIISPDAAEIRNCIEAENLDRSFFTILDFVPYEEIHNYISCADIGIVAVPPFPSQKFRTPVKTGLYLSCGIPYIINKGIAEDDLIAENERVGCVINDFLDADVNQISNDILTLLNDPQISTRCREVALKYRSHQKAIITLAEILEDVYI